MLRLLTEHRASLPRPRPVLQESLDAVEGEVTNAQQTVWDRHRWDGLNYLDASVAMLTLGRQGIRRDPLRANLQGAAVATVYLLAPRVVEIAAAGARASLAAGARTSPSRATGGGRRPVWTSPASTRGQEQAEALATALFQHEGEEQPPWHPATDMGLVPSSAAPGGDAPPRKVGVVPRVNAHWEALGEMPGPHAARFAEEVDVALRRRGLQLTRVLDEHGVPASWRDRRNLVCGLQGVTAIRKQGEATRWQAEGGTYATLASVLEAMAACDEAASISEGMEADPSMEGDGDGTASWVRDDLSGPNSWPYDHVVDRSTAKQLVGRKVSCYFPECDKRGDFGSCAPFQPYTGKVTELSRECAGYEGEVWLRVLYEDGMPADYEVSELLLAVEFEPFGELDLDELEAVSAEGLRAELLQHAAAGRQAQGSGRTQQQSLLHHRSAKAQVKLAAALHAAMHGTPVAGIAMLIDDDTQLSDETIASWRGDTSRIVRE